MKSVFVIVDQITTYISNHLMFLLRLGSNIILGVNSMGILLIKPDDKFILFEFTYSEIESLLLDPSDNFITLNLARGPQERQRVYVFETKQKAAIGALVASYYPSIANWIREADAPKRKVKQVRMNIYIVIYMALYYNIFEIFRFNYCNIIFM